MPQPPVAGRTIKPWRLSAGGARGEEWEDLGGKRAGVGSTLPPPPRPEVQREPRSRSSRLGSAWSEGPPTSEAATEQLHPTAAR